MIANNEAKLVLGDVPVLDVDAPNALLDVGAPVVLLDVGAPVVLLVKALVGLLEAVCAVLVSILAVLLQVEARVLLLVTLFHVSLRAVVCVVLRVDDEVDVGAMSVVLVPNLVVLLEVATTVTFTLLTYSGGGGGLIVHVTTLES